jgi:phosphate acetyltransferase
MTPMEQLLQRATRSCHHILLSEGSDPRAVTAAHEATSKGIARVGLVGKQSEIQAQFQSLGLDVIEGITIYDPETSPLSQELSTLFYELRKHKGVSEEQAAQFAQNPHIFAALMVKAGHADGTVGGAVATTAEIVRTAIQVIGAKPGSKLISSFFLMLMDAPHHARKGAVIFSDSGLVVDPDAEAMAQIALSSAASYKALTLDDPRVAMLSFSTRGSAKHPAVTKVANATQIAKDLAPELLIDGELQFDAAFVPEVSAKKAPDSPLKGAANVFIFPNLESGNIAYKIAQRIGGAKAIGPVLQGLAHPANDLSRGCSADDIVNMIAVTSAQATDTPS